ncbi:MAG: hypothetical protein ACTSUE_21505 [Promethearchaeota archaeon]
MSAYTDADSEEHVETEASDERPRMDPGTINLLHKLRKEFWKPF